jgi:hypothetical protein
MKTARSGGPRLRTKMLALADKEMYLRRRRRRFHYLGELRSPNFSHDDWGSISRGRGTACNTPYSPTMQAGMNFAMIEKARDGSGKCERAPPLQEAALARLRRG